jgi:hypothetical protein
MGLFLVFFGVFSARFFFSFQLPGGARVGPPLLLLPLSSLFSAHRPPMSSHTSSGEAAVVAVVESMVVGWGLGERARHRADEGVRFWQRRGALG